MCPDVEVEAVSEVGDMVTVVEPELAVMVIVVAEAGLIVMLEPEHGVMVIVHTAELLASPKRV